MFSEDHARLTWLSWVALKFSGADSLTKFLADEVTRKGDKKKLAVSAAEYVKLKEAGAVPDYGPNTGPEVVLRGLDLLQIASVEADEGPIFDEDSTLLKEWLPGDDVSELRAADKSRGKGCHQANPFDHTSVAKPDRDDLESLTGNILWHAAFYWKKLWDTLRPENDPDWFIWRQVYLIGRLLHLVQDAACVHNAMVRAEDQSAGCKAFWKALGNLLKMTVGNCPPCPAPLSPKNGELIGQDKYQLALLKAFGTGGAVNEHGDFVIRQREFFRRLSPIPEPLFVCDASYVSPCTFLNVDESVVAAYPAPGNEDVTTPDNYPAYQVLKDTWRDIYQHMNAADRVLGIAWVDRNLHRAIRLAGAKGVWKNKEQSSNVLSSVSGTGSSRWNSLDSNGALMDLTFHGVGNVKLLGESPNNDYDYGETTAPVGASVKVAHEGDAADGTQLWDGGFFLSGEKALPAGTLAFPNSTGGLDTLESYDQSWCVLETVRQAYVTGAGFLFACAGVIGRTAERGRKIPGLWYLLPYYNPTVKVLKSFAVGEHGDTPEFVGVYGTNSKSLDEIDDLNQGDIVLDPQDVATLATGESPFVLSTDLYWTRKPSKFVYGGPKELSPAIGMQGTVFYPWVGALFDDVPEFGFEDKPGCGFRYFVSGVTLCDDSASQKEDWGEGKSDSQSEYLLRVCYWDCVSGNWCVVARFKPRFGVESMVVVPLEMFRHKPLPTHWRLDALRLFPVLASSGYTTKGGYQPQMACFVEPQIVLVPQKAMPGGYVL
jgi:hypothetical protein